MNVKWLITIIDWNDFKYRVNKKSRKRYIDLVIHFSCFPNKTNSNRARRKSKEKMRKKEWLE